MTFIERERFYSCAEIARIVFGCEVETFWKQRRALHLCDGFPRPISSVGRARWYGGDVLDWIERDKSPAPGQSIVVDLRVKLAERARLAAAV